MNDPRTDQYADPLGLRQLPPVEPRRDGWHEIRTALEADRTDVRRRAAGRWLALAACLVVALGLVFMRPEGDVLPGTGEPDTVPALATAHDGPFTDDIRGSAQTDPEALADLIAMSQVLERRLRALRDHTGAIPADSALYVAELEDLVARVDNQLSDQPGSIDLWGQRVNLMLDLESLYQHQFEREYGRMASL